MKDKAPDGTVLFVLQFRIYTCVLGLYSILHIYAAVSFAGFIPVIVLRCLEESNITIRSIYFEIVLIHVFVFSPLGTFSVAVRIY